MMNPIQLTSPEGVVYAYACGSCHRVGISGTTYSDGKGPVPQLVESSQRSALHCCTCYDCGKHIRNTRSMCLECNRWQRWRQAWHTIGYVHSNGMTELQWHEYMDE